MKRASGVLMHISSLYGDYSIGSFGKEARSFVDFLSSGGFTYWQVLPFCLPDECNSPYKSFGAFSGNPYFIDLPTLFEKGLITKKDLDDAKQTSPYLCEFERLKKERLLLLEKASNNFNDHEKLDKFYEEFPEVLQFCNFMALKKANGNLPHNEWSVFVPDETALNLWKFIEYEFFTEWLSLKEYANSKGVKIIGDMPIYVDYDSSDLYYNKNEFLLDKNGNPSLVAGVPPDYFSKEGQLWGNPLYDWDKMKTNGYSWWLKRLDFHKKIYDGVRIDHFRAFQDFYSVKAGEKTAINGKWKKGPRLSLINAFKKNKGDFTIIAEDLGVITNEVRKLVEKSGFPGMRVLQFAFLGDSNSPHLPHNYINNSVAYTGTHDNNTLLGFVWESSVEERNKMLDYFNIPKERWNDAYEDIIIKMLSSSAGLTIFPIQDLLKYGSDTRLNTPGVPENNWAFRTTKDGISKIDLQKYKYYNALYSRT